MLATALDEVLDDALFVVDPDTTAVLVLPLVVPTAVLALVVPRAALALVVPPAVLTLVVAALKAAEEEVLAVLALLLAVTDEPNAGTAVTVGEVVDPLAPALHAASTATPLATPT